MNSKDCTLLSIGVGIVVVAYLMKKRRFEGFQGDPAMGMQPPMGQPPMGQPPMGQPPMGQPPMGQPPMGMQPPMPPPMAPQPPMGQPPMGQPPMGMQPPMPPMGPPQPPMQGMKPNQQQLMDLSQRVQRLTNEQNSISAQLQQMVQSFGSKEGFQSYQNPYNAASPGNTQAMEFRLGKKSLVDSVVRY